MKTFDLGDFGVSVSASDEFKICSFEAHSLLAMKDVCQQQM